METVDDKGEYAGKLGSSYQEEHTGPRNSGLFRKGALRPGKHLLEGADPHLTDRKFPGNPARSYHTRSPLRVVGEVTEPEGHPPEVLQRMRDHLARLKEQGTEPIDD